jgi:ATP/ADP translocase
LSTNTRTKPLINSNLFNLLISIFYSYPITQLLNHLASTFPGSQITFTVMETDIETGTQTLNVLAILLFFGLAAVAALVIMITGKILFKKFFNFFVLFLSAIAGGCGGILILYFGSELQRVKEDTSISSISTLIIMVSVLVLGMMIAFPMMTLILRQRRHKIRELQEENRKLKEKVG